MTYLLKIETGVEQDGRPYAIVPSLPGVMAYGATREEAIAKVQPLALEALAWQLEEQGGPTEPLSLSFSAA